MNVRDDRREAAIEKMADHLLKEGLPGASLRALAAAAGASDRMLLYYFADKDELMAATLERVALRQSAVLDAAIPPGVRLPGPSLLKAVWGAMASSDLQPFMHLWLDLAAGAGRGVEPHRTIAGRIVDAFLQWTQSRLEPEPGSDPAAQAGALLATFEGLLLLAAVGRRDVAEAAVEALGTG